MSDELLVDVVEAARRLGVGRSKIYELMGAGELKSLHVGKLRRVVVADLISARQPAGLSMCSWTQSCPLSRRNMRSCS